MLLNSLFVFQVLHYTINEKEWLFEVSKQDESRFTKFKNVKGYKISKIDLSELSKYKRTRKGKLFKTRNTTIKGYLVLKNNRVVIEPCYK